jgi:hypothetical protein
MKITTIILATTLAVSSSYAFAAGVGGAGGGAGGAGGSSGSGSAGAAGSPSGGTTSSNSASAGAAGAGSAAVSGVPNGPAQIGGPNNAVDDPSGVLNAGKNPTSPGTVGVAPSRPTVPQGATPRDNGTVNEPSVGTNSLGTASPSGGTSGNVARRDNGTLAPGPGKPTVTCLAAKEKLSKYIRLLASAGMADEQQLVPFGEAYLEESLRPHSRYAGY